MIGQTRRAKERLRVRISATLPRTAELLRNIVKAADAELVEEGRGSRPARKTETIVRSDPPADINLRWYAEPARGELEDSGGPHEPVIIVLTQDRLLEASMHMLAPDSWLFSDCQIQIAYDIMHLGLDHHCIVPDCIRSMTAIDTLRIARLPNLNDAEHRILLRLAQGATNASIAGSLELRESKVKYHVRSILTKLRLANRTEAGVFAALHLDDRASLPAP